MLEGMNCKRFIDKFTEAKVSLEEFLTISDIRLEEIGILFPYQRKMIQQGLYEYVTHFLCFKCFCKFYFLLKFHKKDWSKMSNPIFDEDVENCM